MNRSGLLFQGMRQRPSVEDMTKDGLLTAEEARSLRFWTARNSWCYLRAIQEWERLHQVKASTAFGEPS